MKREKYIIPKNQIKPFWSWNDKLDKDKLCSQIEEMKSVGIGGFFMHARGGCITEYMGEEWFQCIESCLNYADELGIEAWAYDENGWPSGFANGLVPRKGEEYQQKMLSYTILSEGDKLPERLIGLYRVRDGKITSLNALEHGCIAIFYYVKPYYIDAFNEDSVSYFIECTHQKYYENFKDRFGKSLKGFFTDEPQYGNGGDIPWSQVFPKCFKKKYGYDILPELPLLFFETTESYRFRSDFYNMVSETFRNSFVKQMYNWCSEHNCKLTGHMMNEQSLLLQTNSTGGVMSCYEYFHEPGVDWLNREIGNPLVPKQLGSVACQLGKKTITESFALCGWDVSLNELKWIAQWQFVNGVTSVCPHLEAYSLRGFRKRDYPASYFVQIPWFKKAYSKLIEYLSILGGILDDGKDISPLLMIHPIQSAYLLKNPSNNSLLNELDRRFGVVVQALNDNHILHHYGDETILSHYGEVKGRNLNVGKCSYSAVLLPELEGLTSFTVDLLLEFVKNGGQVYCLCKMPRFINGRRDMRIDQLEKYVCYVDNIPNLKNKTDWLGHVKIQTDGKENHNIHYCSRVMPDGTTVYYLVNLSGDDQTVKFSVNGLVTISEWNIVDNTCAPIALEYINNCTIVTLNFSIYESHILKTCPSDIKNNLIKTERLYVENIFDLTACTINALTLDKCEYRIDGGEWQPEKAVILLQNELLTLRRACDIELKFHFSIEDISICNILNMCVETPSKFSFMINGNMVEFKDNGFFIDDTFRSMSIVPYVIKGTNEIVISGKFYQNENVYKILFTPSMHETELNKLTYDTELESIYITGNFGVRMNDKYSYGERRSIYGGSNFIITAQQKQLDITKITEQGYWFFAGEMDLTQKIEVEKHSDIRYIISMKKLNSPSAEIWINGEKAGLIAFAPFQIDVTNLLNDGENILMIKLLSGNRNLLGPHHKPYGESYSVGPDTFTDKLGWYDPSDLPTWTNNYNFVLFGAEF